MSLKTLLEPCVRDLEDACVKHDEKRFISYYAPNAFIVEISDNKAYIGKDAILKMFQMWKSYGQWTSASTNEEFDGSEANIRYSGHNTLTFTDGKQMGFDFVQHWRKVDGKYMIEAEHFMQ